MKINTALILCAGFGKRLNPLTLKTPKPLLKLNNLTMLENCINLNVKLGEFINIPSDNSPLGEKYSGCWLISNIRHAIPSLQNYKMILTLIRDSKIESP